MMKVTLWGTRGSIATPGPETQRYGGNTSCVEVVGQHGTILVLDAGTGIRRLGATLPFGGTPRVDILLTHLHLDHIQGLGFFGPLYDPNAEVHIWGPASTTLGLRTRLARYLSPPLFPVLLRDLNCKLTLHEVPCGRVRIGDFHITAARVMHPGPTVGYRIESDSAVLAYMPDHEPAIGGVHLSDDTEWISGAEIAKDADLLIHDMQYTDEEYSNHVGWGHSAVSHVNSFASKLGVKTLVPFHHDPGHVDEDLDRIMWHAVDGDRSIRLVPGMEGEVFEL